MIYYLLSKLLGQTKPPLPFENSRGKGGLVITLRGPAIYTLIITQAPAFFSHFMSKANN